MGTTNDVLAAAHRTLDKANKFTGSVVGQSGGGSNAFAPTAPKSPAAERTNYSHAREARKAPGEFMGIRSDEAPELNTALKAREDFKAAQ